MSSLEKVVQEIRKLEEKDSTLICCFLWSCRRNKINVNVTLPRIQRCGQCYPPENSKNVESPAGINSLKSYALPRLQPVAVADMVNTRCYAEKCRVLDRIGSIVEGGEILFEQKLQKKHLNSTENQRNRKIGRSAANPNCITERGVRAANRTDELTPKRSSFDSSSSQLGMSTAARRRRSGGGGEAAAQERDKREEQLKTRGAS
jgi:hypothetical protein